MAKKPTSVAKSDEIPATQILELVLETKTVKVWDPILTVGGRQIAEASIDDLKDLQKRLQEQIKEGKKEEIFSEIEEVQKILGSRPIKRDSNGKPVLHPQAGVPQIEDISLEEQRPRNRMLWAIEEALKGKAPADVKKIVIKFHSMPDLKKPKYADALLLCTLVGYDTEKNKGLGIHFVDFAMKFNHIRDENGELIEDDEARPTLKTQANAIISQSK